ncbi:MAG: hypothetical protein WAQ99_08765 [Pyrinomonadaceae bacterium]
MSVPRAVATGIKIQLGGSSYFVSVPGAVAMGSGTQLSGPTNVLASDLLNIRYWGRY